ncbi:nuclear transport factor 2 family protein [Luteimonas gilva]|uniref:Nuclear transport factor 2 family protein n=1 Tax=Luteimonas gilva TaxID=2572684 RepID=A0A4U5JL90_9GAMM|nr:nuclear transport factor 2 family protein [Luteimonas gilva]TKR30254.1 nuclear transport factor 2 family protein [Luteimonas gilva]
MTQMSAAQAAEFAGRWLPAWTGNGPETLAGFYAEDAFYSDPAVPDGLSGRPALLAYFRKLLARNPDWVWTQIEGIPMQAGFLNKWRVRIPLARGALDMVGVCLVQFDAAGKIRRNEVYFDRTPWLAALSAAAKAT